MGFVVLLKQLHSERSLPIFIGAAEAQAIALCLNKVEVPRPLTHDLLKNILDCIECRIHRVEIHAIKEGTFFARLVLESGGMEISVDARPSDAIALSLRTAAPIVVAEPVMDEAGRVVELPGEKALGRDDGQADAAEVSALDSLKQQLDKAVTEERFEDAAGLRDQIKHLEHTGRHN